MILKMAALCNGRLYVTESLKVDILVLAILKEAAIIVANLCNKKKCNGHFSWNYRELVSHK